MKNFKSFLNEQDSDFVTKVMAAIKRIAAENKAELEADTLTLKSLTHDAKRLEAAGFTHIEAVNYLRQIENVTPGPDESEFSDTDQYYAASNRAEDRALKRMAQIANEVEKRTGKKLQDIHVYEQVTAGNAHLAAGKTVDALTDSDEFKRITSSHANLARQLKMAWEGDLRDAKRSPNAVDTPTLFDKILAKFMKENQLLDKVVTDLKALAHLHFNTFHHKPLDKSKEVPDKWPERYSR